MCELARIFCARQGGKGYTLNFTLPDMIGEDIKVFCEGVPENIRKDKTEYRLRMLFDGLLCVSIWYLANWGLSQGLSLNLTAPNVFFTNY